MEEWSSTVNTTGKSIFMAPREILILIEVLVQVKNMFLHFQFVTRWTHGLRKKCVCAWLYWGLIDVVCVVAVISVIKQGGSCEGERLITKYAGHYDLLMKPPPPPPPRSSEKGGERELCHPALFSQKLLGIVQYWTLQIFAIAKCNISYCTYLIAWHV